MANTKKSETQNTRSNNQSTGIDRIEFPPSQTTPSHEKGWVTILQKFNPLGAIAEAYGRTLIYRLESKRIDAEIIRVNTQAQIIHTAIDNAYKLQMEHLSQRKLSLNRQFDTVQGELKLKHLERMTLLKMAEETMRHMLSPGLPIEERQNCKDMVAMITSQLPIFGQSANQTLQILIDALPQVNLPTQLMLPDAKA